MTAPYYKKNYTLHWAVLLIALGGLILPHWTRAHPTFAFWHHAPASVSERVNWYFIIRMPEITTQHESGVETMKGRLTEWLKLLRSQGFHPMLLSDVLSDLQAGRGLPPKTIVTVFNPGYRRTYQIVSPILAQLAWPAVLLTDDLGMRHADRRFVTYHTTRLMKESGLWDVGFVQGSGDMILEDHEARTFHIREGSHHPGTDAEGAYARNEGYNLEHLNFLPINSSWLAPELLNRLLVEAPSANYPIALTKGIIQGREWGITSPRYDGALDTRFDLKAPLNRRGTKLFWLGTNAVHNAEVHVDCAQIIGEFWTQLRVDDATGYAIYVIYTDKMVAVIEKEAGTSRRLFLGPHAAPPSGHGFTEDLTLAGGQLQFAFNGDPLRTVNGLRPPVAHQGTFQIYIADKVYGTARADAVHITFKGLSQPLP